MDGFIGEGLRGRDADSPTRMRRRPAVDEDAEWERWRRWLGDEPSGRNIYAQTVEMLAFRQIWDGFAYVYNNAPKRARETGTFLLWVRYSYARSQGWAFDGWRTRARTSCPSLA
jgi:hypothetical protein